MIKMSDVHKKRYYQHCNYEMNFYLAMTTKGRIRCFDAEILAYLKNTFDEIAKRWEVRILDFKGGNDYVYLLLDCNQRIRISEFVKTLKGTSSVHVRREFKSYLSQFSNKTSLWEPHYCIASTEPKTTDGKTAQQIVEEYIANKKLKT